MVYPPAERLWITDRKSTRLNSSHSQISYAVFCLKKKMLRHAVVRLNLHVFAVRLVDRHRHRLAGRQAGQPRDADPILLFDLVKVLGVGEGQGEDPLLL